MIKDNAVVYESARIYGNAVIKDNAIIGGEANDVRTYYVIDTQFLDVPFYVLQDLIKNELDNGYSKKNRLIIIVYPDTEVEHISLDIPIFLALLQFSEKDISINFYDNKQL